MGSSDLFLIAGVSAMIIGGAILMLRARWMGEEALARHVRLITTRAAETDDIVDLANAQSQIHRKSLSEYAHRLATAIGPAAVRQRYSGWIRAAVAFVAAAAAVLFGPVFPLFHNSWILIAAGLATGLIGWFSFDVIVRRWREQRIEQVVRGLPEALELLVVCIEAGLSLEDGLSRTVCELRASQPILAEELGLTLADLQLLSNREEALMGLAKRVDHPVVQSIVSSLSQTMRYGTPISRTIRVLASDLRNEALLRIEERANKLPVLMTIPMMLFILPTMFFVVAGPATLKLIDTFLR